MAVKAGIFTMSDTQIEIGVLYFANLKDITGTREENIIVESGLSIADLKEDLCNKHPKLRNIITISISSLNQEFVNDSQIIDSKAEIAFFPPVSGGSGSSLDTVLITESEIDLNKVSIGLMGKDIGAACVFSGYVRELTNRGKSRKTIHLEYESYIPMAERKMRKICLEIRERWSQVKLIYMVQRIGILQPGDITIAIGCSSGHRDEGIFDAARYGIDRMKEIVPVWKKEVADTKSDWIAGEYHPKAGD